MFNKRESIEITEAGLEDALRNFRSSVHAWSEAEFVRPRTMLVAEHRRTWRRAAAWALGCALAAGTLSAGVYEHHFHNPPNRLAAQAGARQQHLPIKRDAAQEQGLAEDATGAAAQTPSQPQGADEKLMAAVDQDVSQPVASAMEPLARLMDEGESQ
jgi:hypothetical protein